jgi:hypothetical protein
MWEQFVKLANEMETTRVSLLNSCSETISGMMHGAFHAPTQRGAAFELIHWLPHESRKEFLSELIELASYANKYTEEARSTILELPRDWTVANIRSAYEPILQRDSADVEEFGLLLSLVNELDESFAKKIALKAVKHRNPSCAGNRNYVPFESKFPLSG